MLTHFSVQTIDFSIISLVISFNCINFAREYSTLPINNMGLAEKSFLQALKMKAEYLPQESAAPCYLGLCETALHRKDYEQVKEYARKALEEPGIIPMNQITAWEL